MQHLASGVGHYNCIFRPLLSLDVLAEPVLNPVNFEFPGVQMEFLRQLYDWNERTFWNSLTKKFMSFLLLFFIDVGYLGIYFHQKGVVSDALRASGANAESLQRISSS